MAYDFGSQTLGIKNPFKTEGKIRFVAGVVLVLAAIIPLLSVSSALKDEAVYGYTYAILGFILIASGFRLCGLGLFQLFKYFVGRSVPTSLAFNRSRSEQQTASAEKKSTMYTDDSLHSMLMGRKNSTFLEPVGWVSRLIHSVIPDLIFLPFRLRVLAQVIGSALLNFAVALVCFAVVYFVVSTGMAGEIAKELTMPIFSIILLIYLISSWRSAASQATNLSQLTMPSTGGVSVGVLIGLSIIVPVLSGFVLDKYSGLNQQDVMEFMSTNEVFGAGANLALLAFAIALTLIVVPPLLARLKEITPSTEVSEYRSNMQESVHPNEIFINIENIVLANRRYKEIPNRVYREYDPKLTDQTDGKGSFAGQLLIETQPTLSNEQPLENANLFKLLTTIFAQSAVLIGFYFLYTLGMSIAELIIYWRDSSSGGFSGPGLLLTNAILFNFFAWLSFLTAGKLLNAASQLFWGELRFNSLLMYMKTEGTYTESKISTGMSIHDSTRSENVVVRSSITPWIITSQITSSIFATSGASNLEAPRLIMGMHKTDGELSKIVDEIVGFLRGRESIASITNESDLQNASTIHQVNEQSRAIPTSAPKLEEQDEQAAGFLRNDPSRADDGQQSSDDDKP
jgi:hypothetical protein